MPAPFSLPASLQGFLDRRPGSELQKIHAEASRRSFYRIRRGKQTLVAMVYPEPAPVEIERFCALQKLYRELGLRVPRIDRVLDDQVVLQEDLGDLLLQRAWRAAGRERRRSLLAQCREILAGLAAIPAALATARLDPSRRKWEMDFFTSHFSPHFPCPAVSGDNLRRQLHRLVEAVDPESAFAHRDFHSRNLLVLKQGLAMVDFQDSLVAPRYYDLVSLAFDSYIDLGADRGRLFPNLAAGGDDRELRQLRLTALQRNIKALGTFAFQTFERRHKVYARYIPRTLRHIRSHLQALNDPRFNVLAKYFDSVTRDA
jgi:aminoglycoside/choline kinase family phosphotransferase